MHSNRPTRRFSRSALVRRLLARVTATGGCAAVALTVTAFTARAEVRTIAGAFGELQVDTDRPAATSLRLRTGAGELDAKSVLSPKGEPWLRGMPDWGTQAYTYVVDADGRRYESRTVAPLGVDATAAGGLTIRGIKLVAAADAQPVATEDWTLNIDGADLVWTVERTWDQDFTARLSGSPALFFSNRPLDPATSRILENGVATTWWVDPATQQAEFEPLYRPAGFHDAYKWTRNNSLWSTDPDTWAIFKLWTNWHHRADVKLAAAGGHLYRRGAFGWIGEAGIVAGGGGTRLKTKGLVERTSLRIAPSERTDTGYQLAIDIPDKALADTMSSHYSSLMNAGVVADQHNYDFGNQVDGWYYAGSSWMQGFALSVGMPAKGQLAQHPYDWAKAFRGRLAHVIGTMQPDGRTRFGYNFTGEFVDDNLHTIIGMHAYLMHTGDVAFVRQQLPALETMLEYFVSRRNAKGLYDLGPIGHWYYDAMPSSGVNSYHNAFFFKALTDMADLQRAAGTAEKAGKYTDIAAQVKRAFNEVLWFEDAPGGPRYCDWITHAGEKITYGADVCQFPPVALGIASDEQARKLLATLDRRIVELKAQHGYTHQASFSAYWPVPDHINPISWQRAYPIYMNGGSFLAQTYWEVMARARGGDADGALGLLQRFAEGARKHSFTGNNWFTVTGAIGNSPSDEPYLADMVVVPASIVRGLLGVNPTWDRLDVTPHLPTGWPRATVDVVYKGGFQRITVGDGPPRVEPLGRQLTPVNTLEHEVRGALSPAWLMYLQRDFTTGNRWSKSDSIDLRGGQFIRIADPEPQGLVGHWLLGGGASGDPLADATGRANKLTASPAGVTFDATGPTAGTGAARFDGQGTLTVTDGANFAFTDKDSFTVQCWFNTDAANSTGVLVIRPESYCLSVKDGKLSAWIMADGLHVREAAGSTTVTDGKWHHAAVVVNRATQQLSVYLDGKLDAVAQAGVVATNPVDISSIGGSSSTSPLAIGSLGGNYAYKGLIADVAVVRSAEPPAPENLGRIAATPAKAGEPETTGWYVAGPSDWGAAARVTTLQVDAAINGGVVEAIVETSDDNFETVSARHAVLLRDGRHHYTWQPETFRGARAARVRFELTRGDEKSAPTPEVRSFRLLATPEK